MEKSIIIIDDEPDIRESIRSILEKSFLLEKYNLHCIDFPNGRAFLDYALTAGSLEDVYGILVDIIMPELSGIKLLIELTKNQLITEIPIMYLTAYPNEEEILSSFDKIECLAIDYLPKPFDISWLVTKLNNMLKMKDNHEKLKSS